MSDLSFGKIEGDEFTPTSEKDIEKAIGISARDFRIISKACIITYLNVRKEIEDIVKGGDDVEAAIYRWLAKLPSITIDREDYKDIL